MPITLYEYLKQHYPEGQPGWLDLARPDADAAARRALLDGFLQSRIVYYPGSAWDGQPVRLFNRSHAAHAYVYVDYGLPREEMYRSFTPDGVHPWNGFRGYRLVCALEYKRQELAPAGYCSRYGLRGWHSVSDVGFSIQEPPYSVLFVYEREEQYGDEHGAMRFGVLTLLADGFAAYEALFCQPGSVARPFCVVVQDHGFGGNWDEFGAGGMLERLAVEAHVAPELLLVADNSRPWQGYSLPKDVQLHPDIGGEYSARGHERTLYLRNPDWPGSAWEPRHDRRGVFAREPWLRQVRHDRRGRLLAETSEDLEGRQPGPAFGGKE